MASHGDREISSATAANLSFKHAEYEALRQEILTRNEFRQRTVELHMSGRRVPGRRQCRVTLPGVTVAHDAITHLGTDVDADVRAIHDEVCA